EGTKKIAAPTVIFYFLFNFRIYVSNFYLLRFYSLHHQLSSSKLMFLLYLYDPKTSLFLQYLCLSLDKRTSLQFFSLYVCLPYFYLSLCHLQLFSGIGEPTVY